jgi:hypothetical protein
MGRIHSIKPPAPGPAEAVLWARMAKLLTLVGNNVQDGPDTHRWEWKEKSGLQGDVFGP